MVCLQGLAVGDLIIQFGSVKKSNFQGLQSIGQVVQHSEGVSLISSKSISNVLITWNPWPKCLEEGSFIPFHRMFTV